MNSTFRSARRDESSGGRGERLIPVGEWDGFEEIQSVVQRSIARFRAIGRDSFALPCGRHIRP
jgi:hypothetical protein